MPFLAEFLWRRLRADEAPESVFLEPWPEVRPRDEELLREVGEVRRIVELGRQARGDAGLKLRQPLRRLVVEGAGPARRHADMRGTRNADSVGDERMPDVYSTYRDAGMQR